jgi:phosphoribosylaminoimidazole-succinocarboxamide synthase
MAQISQDVLDRSPAIPGLNLIGRGKVRDTYDFGDKLLVTASDRCSIFDFVLNTLIPQKGEVLTALNHFWVKEVIGDLFETDLIACGKGIENIDEIVPDILSDPEVQKRSTVVRRLLSPDIEDIVRLYLTGSGWESYKETGQVCGHKLPQGLENGSILPFPIYTPTTKATAGHDEHITADSAVLKYGFGRERIALQVAGLMANYAATRGILLADIKFEFWKSILLDEKGTPDSSRFWDKLTWEQSMMRGKVPPSLDKQYVREWGKRLGIDKRDPEVPEDIAYVHSLVVPEDVVKMTTLIYRYIFWRLTGRKLEKYQSEELRIDIGDHKPHIEIVVGSSNDLKQLNIGLEHLRWSGDFFRVSVMSCHRNAAELRTFTQQILSRADRVIACAGKAAALPGMIKSWLCEFGHPEIPVIGVALKGQTPEDDRDAVGSIKGLPGQPVELDEDGKVYFGPNGFAQACISATEGEFLPKNIEVKPAEIGVIVSN